MHEEQLRLSLLGVSSLCGSGRRNKHLPLRSFSLVSSASQGDLVNQTPQLSACARAESVAACLQMYCKSHRRGRKIPTKQQARQRDLRTNGAATGTECSPLLGAGAQVWHVWHGGQRDEHPQNSTCSLGFNLLPLVLTEAGSSNSHGAGQGEGTHLQLSQPDRDCSGEAVPS